MRRVNKIQAGGPCRGGIPAHFAPHAAVSLAPPRMFTTRFMLYAKNDSDFNLSHFLLY